MDVLTNRVERSEIRRGDHIYTYRGLAVFTYSHHGIFVGGNRVVHFSPDGNLNSSSWISSDSSFCKSAVICSSYPECGFRQPNSGVLRSCLDCFLGNGFLYRFKYGVSPSFFLAQVRGGTCSIANSDPPEQVIHRTMYLLQSGFGNYDVLLNNCEDFALYCKTGLRVVGGRNRTETGNTGVGGSGQTSSFVGVPLAAVVSSTLKWLVPIPVRMAAAAVGYAGMYCMTRYANDIGVREDVMKVAVEDLAENMGWEGNEAYFVQMNSVLVPILDGTNFTEWSQQVRFHLRFLDLDLALRINKPHAITKSSNAKERVMYKSWERSNRLSIMFMRNTIESNINSVLPECDNAKEFFKTVKKRFTTVEKRFQLADNCFYGRARIRQHLTPMLVFLWVIIVSVVVGLWLK